MWPFALSLFSYNWRQCFGPFSATVHPRTQFWLWALQVQLCWLAPLGHSLKDLFQCVHQCGLADVLRALLHSTYSKFLRW